MRHIVVALALLIGALLVPATAVADGNSSTTVFTEPFDFSVINPCTGEVVALSGTSHFVFHLTRDEAGGFHVHSHETLQHVKGIGTTTGTTYVAAASSVQVETFPGGFFDRQMSVRFPLILVSQGSADNFRVEYHFHVTVNANGVITVYFEDISTQCTG